MRNILDYTLSELQTLFQEEFHEPRFRANQVWQWLWQKLARDFSCMSDVSQKTRAFLAEAFTIDYPEIIQVQQSADETKKLLLEYSDGARIETVLIPSADHSGKIRWSQCLSSQVGCPMGCTFCATGTMGFERNLTVSEIAAQVLIAREFLNDVRTDHPIIRNLVFMGMGEPLLNLDNLLKALSILNDPKGCAFSPRRITVSTCGIKNGLERLGNSELCYLAISLHAADQSTRARIMPRAASLDLEDLLDLVSHYPLKKRERITFEYLLLDNVNDSLDDARRLAKIVKQIKGKLNLIVFNPSKNLPYAAPSEEKVLAFEKELWKANVVAIRRQSKGADIAAACGQLKASVRDRMETDDRRSASEQR